MSEATARHVRSGSSGVIPLPLPNLDAPQRPVAGTDYSPVLDRLASAAFRRRKRLLATEREQLHGRGMTEVLHHARELIEERVAPASPADDGRQTPYRGHPVFIAQHATATCCRGCLEIWHSIPKGRALATTDVDWIVGLIEAWLRRETGIQEPDLVASSARRAPRKRRSARLQLVVAEERAAEAPPGAMVLEECDDGGTVARRWLQLELFGATLS